MNANPYLDTEQYTGHCNGHFGLCYQILSYVFWPIIVTRAALVRAFSALRYIRGCVVYDANGFPLDSRWV